MNLTYEELCPFVVKAKEKYFYFYMLAGVLAPIALIMVSLLDQFNPIHLVILLVCSILNGSSIILYRKSYREIGKTIGCIVFYFYIIYTTFNLKTALSSPIMLLSHSMMIRNHFLYSRSKWRFILLTLCLANTLILATRTVFFLVGGNIVLTPGVLRTFMLESIISILVCTGSEAYFDIVREEVFNELRSTSERVQREIKEKGTFFACLSHEIRNPLQSLVGCVDLLQNCEDKEHKQTYLDIIKNGCEIVLNLVTNTLDIAKIQAGKMDLNVIPSNLVENVEKVIKIMSERAKGKGLELYHKEFTPIPKSLKFDSQKLQQVIINLVSNAIKFTKKGRILVCSSWLPIESITNDVIREKLKKSDWKESLYPVDELNEEEKNINKGETLTLDRQMCPSYSPVKQVVYHRAQVKHRLSLDHGFTTFCNKPGNHSACFSRNLSKKVLDSDREILRGLIKIEVMDTGMGISKSGLESIFKPYKQADATISRIYGGTGLGLWISRTIIQFMGGDMAIKSRPNFGTNVMLVLPCEVSPNKVILLSQKDSFIIRDFKGKNKKCLVVDDDSDHLYVLAKLLETDGFTTISKTKAEDAFKVFIEEKDTNLIITDLKMPEMSGQELIKKVRNYEKTHGRLRIPIIVLTGETEANVRLECLSNKAVDEYLLKPLKFKDLLGIIKKLLSPNRVPKIENILIIDDDVVSEKIMERLMEQLKIKSKGCYTIKEAKEEWINYGSKYDLIFLDNQLPDGNGLDFMEFYTENLKKGKGKKIPIISMSGNTACDQQMTYKNFNICAFLEKPISKLVLTNLIQSLT